MKTKANILNIGTKISCIIIFFFMAISSLSVNGQVKYNSANELSEAEMGVERVARYYLPAYSTKANNNNETRWVQIDLGQVKKIDGIKLLPGAQGWGPASGGFPARFKIEFSDVVDFRYSIMYEDYTLKKKFPNPDDEVVTFSSKEVNGRYVRLTAIQLKDNKLAMTKIIVLSDGKDIAEGCTATNQTLTRTPILNCLLDRRIRKVNMLLPITPGM